MSITTDCERCARLEAEIQAIAKRCARQASTIKLLREQIEGSAARVEIEPRIVVDRS
jgi:hypothetical protein